LLSAVALLLMVAVALLLAVAVLLWLVGILVALELLRGRRVG
jgi:hypothetical protein|tara:strand:+ start:7401 stop:7526 length:126 start_codon:yes stop_codon:yes gene_type:complete